MSEALFLFTIAGVQRFIGEARRLSDLEAGSRLLARLSRVAAEAVLEKGGSLVFPTELSERMPNKLVARVPIDVIPATGEVARNAVEAEWQRQGQIARAHLASLGPVPDSEWNAIWERQISTQWDSFWAAAPLAEQGYSVAYDLASRALEASKRTRPFPQVEEDGLKDSLGGTRSALRTGASRDARGYWAEVARASSPALLKPGGRERLDVAGAVKRFGSLARQILSVSTLAAADFLAAARGTQALESYKGLVKRLLGPSLYTVSGDSQWPYDGDLLYPETLAPRRLLDSYGVAEVDEQMRRQALDALSAVYRQVRRRPSPYYALLMLDGDGMGEQVAACRSAAEHRELSRKVGRFAAGVRGMVEKPEHQGHLVYAGGDDVLALAPLRAALPMALRLAGAFAEEVGGTASASAGLAVVHHLQPLDAALAAARKAERAAKEVRGKAAVGIWVAKRSGEMALLRSPWSTLQGRWSRICELFSSGALSSRFAYDVARSATALSPNLEALAAELRRLIRRHRAHGMPEPEDSFGQKLAEWASSLPDGADGMARWLVFARFVAAGGGE